MYFFFVTEKKPAKMITNKEKTGLFTVQCKCPTMYNLDKTPKNLPVLFLIKEGAVEIS